MSMNTSRVERIIENEKSQLKSILEGITEGILEGIKEGVAEGLKKGARDGLKECLTGDLSNLTPIDISDILEGIGEDVIKIAARESAGNLFGNSTEAYMRGICTRIVSEVQERHIELTEDQIPSIVNLVTKSEQETVKPVMEGLPDNPFVKEIADSVQSAFEESFNKELKLCEHRLRQAVESIS